MVETGLENVYVFKTNISSDEDVSVIKTILNRHTAVKSWNVDREDVDRVLRVKSDTLKEEEIIHLITQFGFICRELV